MSEELPAPPPETSETPAVPTYLDHVKRITIERIVSHMNGVGASIVQQYPMAEVESWPIQKLEAEAAVALGEEGFKALSLPGILSLTPFLLSVTEVHFPGETPEETRKDQVWTKVLSVKANADTWALLSAYVNGLRARTQDRIDAAQTEAEVFTIESETFSELETFRSNAGI